MSIHSPPWRRRAARRVQHRHLGHAVDEGGRFGPDGVDSTDPVAERRRQAGVGPVLDAEGGHLLVRGGDRPLGQGRGGVAVQVRRGPARCARRTRRRRATLSPTPSIHAVPVEPVTLVSTTMPRSDAVLWSTPTQPFCIRKCTTKPSSAVMGRSTTWTTDALTPAKSPSVARIWSISCEPWAPSQPPPASVVGPPGGHDRAGVGEHRHVHQPRGHAGRADEPGGDGLGQQRLPGVEAEFGPQEMDDPGPLGAASSTARPSVVSRAKGFSHRTCLPAPMASSASSAWVCGGVAMVTASMPGSANASVRVRQAAGHLEHRGARRCPVRVAAHQGPDLEAGVAQRPDMGVAPEAGPHHDHPQRLAHSGEGVTSGPYATPGHPAASSTLRGPPSRPASAAACAPVSWRESENTSRPTGAAHADGAQRSEIAGEVELTGAGQRPVVQGGVDQVVLGRQGRVGELHGEDAVGRQGA